MKQDRRKLEEIKNTSRIPSSITDPSGCLLITGDNRFSQLKTCLAAAHHFLLSQKATALIDRIETAIRENWERVCEETELSLVDKNYLWGRQFLNPFSMER
jgi:serine/threonine-protein kinase HipA